MDTELRVIIYCAIVLIILFTMYAIYQQQYSQNLYKTYLLTSNGHITFSNEKISLSIYNQHENQSRYIEIEGINNDTRIHSSALRTSSGNTIKPEVTTSPIVNNSTTATFTFDKEAIQPGSYEGWLIVSGEKSDQAIPVNIYSPPMIPQALFIVGIGSVSSIAFWEFIKYSNRKKISIKREKVDSHAKELFNKTAEKETDPVKKRNILTRASLLKIKTDALYSTEKSLETRYATSTDKAKITVTNVGSSAFGIIVALLGLLNNSYLMAIAVINLQDIGVLFGLGFGAASIKELIDRPS